MSLFVASTTFGRTDAEQNTEQTTQQSTEEECGAHEAQRISLEALISGSKPREYKAEGGGPQSDVEQHVGSLEHTPRIAPAIQTASSERRVVDLNRQMTLINKCL